MNNDDGNRDNGFKCFWLFSSHTCYKKHKDNDWHEDKDIHIDSKFDKVKDSYFNGRKLWYVKQKIDQKRQFERHWNWIEFALILDVSQRSGLWQIVEEIQSQEIDIDSRTTYDHFQMTKKLQSSVYNLSSNSFTSRIENPIWIAIPMKQKKQGLT